jgi:hypothetical protein
MSNLGKKVILLKLNEISMNCGKILINLGVTNNIKVEISLHSDKAIIQVIIFVNFRPL